MRLGKDWPDLTTLHAWLRSPISDSSSLREHAFLSPHPWMRACRRLSLSVGRRSWPLTESISMPRKVRHVDPLFFHFKIVHFPFQIFTNSVSPPEF